MKTETRNREMLRAWQDGMPIVDIARSNNLSLSWTGRLLRQSGAQLPDFRQGVRRVDLDADQIAWEYQDGASIRALAAGHGAAYGTIYRLLQGHPEVTLRQHGGRGAR